MKWNILHDPKSQSVNGFRRKKKREKGKINNGRLGEQTARWLAPREESNFRQQQITIATLNKVPEI